MLFINSLKQTSDPSLLAGIYAAVGILTAIIIGLTIWVIIIKVKKIKHNNSHKNSEAKELNNEQLSQLKLLIAENKEKKAELDKLIDDYLFKLETIASLDHETAREKYKQEINILNKKELNKKYEELERNFLETYKAKTQDMIVSFLERNAEKIVNERATTFVKIEDEQMKARIIGKEGRNKREFEKLTGVELIIEKDNPIITLCSTNLERREIAKLTLSKLLESKIIEPNKIYYVYEMVKEEFEKQLYEIGKNAIEDIMEVYDLDISIYKYVGLLKYRNSYGQNILQHSLECAKLAANIAFEIDIDPVKAKLAAFFHDLGKCYDLDMNLDHVNAGIQIARKCNLPEYVINAIETHHNSRPPYDIYGAIVKVVDTLSSSRPGARNESYEEYVQRVKAIESICLEFDEVSSAYAFKSGRQIRIIVKPLHIKDGELGELALSIKKRIESDELLKKFKIELILFKENKFTISTDIIH